MRPLAALTLAAVALAAALFPALPSRAMHESGMLCLMTTESQPVASSGLAAGEPTLTAAPTRWPLPIVVTGTPLALTERAAFYGTYAAWWTQTPAAPWPWPTAAVGGTVGATATISPTNVATIAPTVGSPAQVPTPTATPVLFPCRFTPTRCGTRAFIAYAGRGRRR